jgi:hypothetical protein
MLSAYPNEDVLTKSGNIRSRIILLRRHANFLPQSSTSYLTTAPPHMPAGTSGAPAEPSELTNKQAVVVTSTAFPAPSVYCGASRWVQALAVGLWLSMAHPSLSKLISSCFPVASVSRLASTNTLSLSHRDHNDTKNYWLGLASMYLQTRDFNDRYVRLIFSGGAAWPQLWRVYGSS